MNQIFAKFSYARTQLSVPDYTAQATERLLDPTRSGRLDQDGSPLKIKFFDTPPRKEPRLQVTAEIDPGSVAIKMADLHKLDSTEVHICWKATDLIQDVIGVGNIHYASDAHGNEFYILSAENLAKVRAHYRGEVYSQTSAAEIVANSNKLSVEYPLARK